MKFVIRLDLEVDIEDEEGVGSAINDLIGFAVEVIEPEHYRWKFTPAEDGLDDPDLEKLMSQATMQG